MLPSGGQAMHRHAPLSSGGGVARNFPSSYLLMLRSHHLRLGALPMRVVVYDEAGDIALDYYTKKDSVSLCPGRLEKALVIEALQEAAFFSAQSRILCPRVQETPRRWI
jgi:hypothetical protein